MLGVGWTRLLGGETAAAAPHPHSGSSLCLLYRVEQGGYNKQKARLEVHSWIREEI